MQLKFKKFGLLCTIFVYCASFLMQSNFELFQTWAKDSGIPRVNIVTILVDNSIYGKISGDLKWYASDYIQGKLTDTKALVIPLDLTNIRAYDIYRMMENIYFDGLKDTNSSLIGLIMFGDIPLPVVNQDGYVFPTVYPYVDFENQKYVWDSDSHYFVSNNNPLGQAEIWHGYINYGNDISAYSKFFNKIRKYEANPNNFIGDSIWYEDFMAQKAAFRNEDYQYYRNKIMFGEDIGYQRYSPLMRFMFGGESASNSEEIVSELSQYSEIDLGGYDIVESLLNQGSSSMHTTKMVQQEIETSYLADYNKIFSKYVSSNIRENIFAGGRWIKLYTGSNGQANQIVDADNSASKIQIKDTLYLGNDDLQGLLENMNLLMEEMIDKKIDKNRYDMDIVVPLSYKEEDGEKADSKCYNLIRRYDNYYFGNNARYIDKASDLSIYRGTYRNLLNLDGVTYEDLQSGENSVVGEYDTVNVKLKSIGASYDIFSTQAEGNKGYALNSVEDDLDIYNDEKMSKNPQTDRAIFGKIRRKTWPNFCDNEDEDYICEDLYELAKRLWGGASPINLDNESISKGRYIIIGYLATDARRKIFSMQGFQSLLPGSDEGMGGRGWVDGKGTGPQNAATSFKAYIKYSSPTEREGWNRATFPFVGEGFEIYENHMPDVHIPFSSINYWGLDLDKINNGKFSKESNKIFNIDYKNPKYICGIPDHDIKRQQYKYKVIRSIVKHTSTTEDEINGISRNKFDESSALWHYYQDLKDSYNDISTNVSESLNSLSELLSTININNNYINDKIRTLNQQSDNLDEIVKELEELQSSLSSLQSGLKKLENEQSTLTNKLPSLRSSLSDLESQLSEVEKSGDKNGEADSLKSKIDGLKNEINNAENRISSIDSEKASVESRISKVQKDIKLKEQEKRRTNGSIDAVLSEVSGIISDEKAQLSEIYGMVSSLFVDNLVTVLEYITYMEGGNPENFYSGKANKKKVGFLSSWISDILTTENDIKSDAKKIISSYESAFDLIQRQQVSWRALANKINEVDESNTSRVNEISQMMNQIFTISEGNNSKVQLNKGTVNEIINGENGMMDKFGGNSGVDKMFSWLISTDNDGTAVERAAKQDKDFLAWLAKNSTDTSKLTQGDWIDKYVEWARGPGENSEGAKKNQDLLDGISEEMPGMDILTSDRPIDSPRYVSIQSVAGNDVKFIYPDLFKVEVYVESGQNKDGYDIHELLTGGEIKKNLEKYLSGKVYEYNKILEEECRSALVVDGNRYFERLKSLGYYMALPDKTIHNCSVQFTYEEFVNTLGGEKMLDVIADMLYYQNLTNKSKLSSSDVAEDIQLIKNSFTLNDKREKTLDDYLIEGNEKVMDTTFVIPTYEKLGYEVAYVNSNGRDYIIPEDDSSATKIAGLTKFEHSDSGASRKVLTRQSTQQEGEYEDECNIPKNGKLPLFKLDGTSVFSPWYEGFKCWLKKTLKEPVKVKLTFDNSLGDILVADSLEDYINNSDLGQYFSDYGDAWTKYGDAWDQILSPDDTHDSDKVITQKQVEADKHNQESIAGDGVGANVSLNLYRNIRVVYSSTLISESTPSNEFIISSLADLGGNVTVEFSSLGDGCISLNGEDLCNKTITKIFNPKTNPFTGYVTSTDHVAGKVALDIKISIGNQYIENVIKYTVSPADLQRAEIKFGDVRTVAGMVSPVEVIGYDKYNNRVSWGIDRYNFSVSQGEFLKDGAYQKFFITNDFRDLKFSYHSPLEAKDFSTADITIQKEKDSNAILAIGSLVIVQADPEIMLNSDTILSGRNDISTNQVYRLKNDEDIYDGDKLNISRLQRLDIIIKDRNGKIIDVDSQLSVSSQKGLVVIGQVQKDEKGDDFFFETSRHHISKGKSAVYYYPTTVAGEDVITIDIPGLETRTINLTVKPSSLSSIQIALEDDVIEIGDTIDVEIFGFDVWGNLVDGVHNVSIGFDDKKVQFLENPSAVQVLNTKITDGYKKLRLLGIDGGATYLIEGKNYVELYVDKHIFPSSGLNVMYLNYFGDDWGNEWGYFSDNNKYIEDVMKKSNKVITTTTQLISEDKIKKMVWNMQPGFKILNFDNIATIMTINGRSMDMLVGGISSMHVDMPNMQITSVTSDSMENLLSKPSSASKNYIFFIPNNKAYYIEDGNLYNSGEFVTNVLGGNASFELTSYKLDNGDNVWSLIDRGIDYGRIVIHFPKFVPNVSYFSLPGERYLVNPTFSNGSTDSLSSVGIFDRLSDFELDSNYKSIQDSDDLEQRIGFLGDFKNITLFAEGEIVGEATKKYGSEFVINLGDPVLSKKDSNDFVNGTKFDGGIGNEIYVDSENDIFGTYQIDFDGNGTKDLLVVYLNGKVKLAKNYGGTPDLRNMQELMRIATNIKDVFIGDADGNKYEDILVRTSNGQLRAYLNTGGVFDVDGSLVCLNQNVIQGQKSSTPSSLDGIFQLFVEDMDLDGMTDIVTYDNKGYIKVFYGGSTNGGPNYLSKDKYSCDPGWYNREIGNTTLVAALGANITNSQIFDNSLLHWKNMERPEMGNLDGDLSLYGVNFDPDSLVGEITQRSYRKDGDMTDLIKDVMENFDEDQSSKYYVEQGAKYVDVSLYENVLSDGGVAGEINNYVFAPSSFLDPSNPDDLGSVRKNYYVKSGSSVLQDGDIVTVRVTVKASDQYGFDGAYADFIQGPWNLYFDEKEVFKGIKFIRNPSNAVVKKRDGRFAYIIDNIKLSPGDKMVFEYDLDYHAIPLRKISITHRTYWSDDDIPDIKMQSVDGCVKDFDAYIGGKRSYSYKSIPLQQMINDEYLEEEDKTEDYAATVIDVGGNVSDLPGIVGNKLDRSSLLKSLDVLGGNLNVDVSAFKDQTDKIEDIIDDITKGMCNGFSFGGSSNCKGLPVPFNQAFLAPGKYHLFGCWELPLTPLDGGVPSFFFPGTLITPFGPLPIPRGLKGGGDDFLWVPGGSYPSFIRIYAAPTLTAQLGVAICLGPYAVGSAIPSPLADIGGNCVVFAVKPQCKGGDADDGRSADPDNPNEVYSKIIEDVRDSGVCLTSQKGPVVTKKGQRSSPFNLYSSSSSNSDSNGGTNYTVQGGFSFMGIIDLEIDSFDAPDEDFEFSTDNSIVIGDVDILGGDFSVNKIRGGLQQGLRKMLIDKWLDPQIRYILNQLTKMHINIKFPDVSNVIDYEAQTLNNVAENIGTIWKSEGSSKNNNGNKLNPLTDWSWNSQENLNRFNKSIVNPFEGLASLMNQSNIINISVEPLTVKVPWIFNEDINAYYIYLMQWLETNEAIVAEWDSVLNALLASCSKEPTPKEQEACRVKARENLDAFIEFSKEGGDWQKMQNQIYANLQVLQRYRNFPFELYERIHVIERYMSEIASLINQTIGYLAYWTSTNSERFVGYIDAIVLMLNIIKTYQILIDFSIEWGQNCGNCTKDTYDQYSCKLSMLCDLIKLPIIQIPNFKLPNITIDLTNIDLGLDIILPDFNFQPVKVNLPDLPNLPEPPSIGVNIKLLDLPDIPVLPEPPELPELPSFIPEIELELPILPPAPEMPKIPNSLEGAIKVAKLIGKIYCIVKGQFGLVGEKSVKAKIEQLTQRTYEVKWIDTIMDFTNRSAAPIKNYGVDYEIDSYVDIQFDFSVFYDYLDMLTKSINRLTTSSVNGLNNQVNQMVNDNKLVEKMNSIDGASIDVNATLIDLDKSNGNKGIIGMNNVQDTNFDGLVSDEIEYVDYDTARDRLNDVLTFFRQETNNTSLGDSMSSSIGKIENQINKSSVVSPNTEGLDDIKNKVNEYLDEESKNYSDLANLINNDYDGFLAMVDAQYKDGTKSDLKEGKLLTFNTQLFNVDSSTKETINNISKTSPYMDLLDNKKEIIDGYWNAINTNSADDLGLSKTQYLVLRNSISSMKSSVDNLYSVTKPVYSSTLIAKDDGSESKKSLFAGLRLGSQTEVANVIDPSVLSNGIYEKVGSDGKFAKVIYSYEFSEKMQNNYYHTTFKDVHDIILWDKNSIYRKCYNQGCIKYIGTYGGYYVSDVVDDIPYVEKLISFGDGMELKIADKDEEVKDWNVAGQTYDILSLSWKKANADVYLIKLLDRIDYAYEKVDYSSKTPAKYVLVLPNNVNLEDLYENNVKIELLNNKVDLIKNLYGKELAQVVYYDPYRASILAAITDVERKRYYARVSTMNLSGDTYYIDSPWSNQVVVGRQIVGDDQDPFGSPLLYRPSVDEIVSEGDDLEGYVGTRYKLIIKWKDNVALSYINLSKGGKLLSEKYTSLSEDEISVDIDIHTASEKEVYTTMGIDQFGNKTEKFVTVSYYIPDITITDISKNPDGESVAITAVLSQDIDQGNVSFQRRRGDVWKTMKKKGAECRDLPIGAGNWEIVGSPYSFGNEIAMYDKDDEVIALMDPDTAEIKIQPKFKDDYEVNVVVQNSAVLQMCNKKSKDNDVVFSISIPTLECKNIEAEGYEVVDLPEKGKMGMFNGGTSVYKDGTNILFVSKTCHLYSELGLTGTYSYDREQDAVVLTLYQFSDPKSNPIKVWMKVKPFLDS